MRNTNSFFENLLRRPVEQDITDEHLLGATVNSEGFYICDKCGKARTTDLHALIRETLGGDVFGCKSTPHIIATRCDCQQEAERMERDELARQQQLREARERCFGDRRIYEGYTFENDAGYNTDVMKRASEYVRGWDKHKQAGEGICFLGTKGSGKTYTAAAIANALIDKGERPLMATLSYLVDYELNWRRDEDKQTPLRFSRFSLFVIDDLGKNRISPTAFEIIDTIYCTGKPIILTTNLSADELRNSADETTLAAYDRLLERACIKVPCYGANLRRL